MLTVNPDPEPFVVVAIPVPVEYPVPPVIPPRLATPDPLALAIVITSDAPYPDPSLLIDTPSTTPLVTVTSTVKPDPPPFVVVERAVPEPYPVPPALIDPRVLTPVAFAFVIVIVSLSTNPVPSLLIVTPVTAPFPSTVMSAVNEVPDALVVVAIPDPAA